MCPSALLSLPSHMRKQRNACIPRYDHPCWRDAILKIPFCNGGMGVARHDWSAGDCSAILNGDPPIWVIDSHG